MPVSSVALPAFMSGVVLKIDFPPMVCHVQRLLFFIPRRSLPNTPRCVADL
jgi:hypothetical protein